jgi:hypothetical protein
MPAASARVRARRRPRRTAGVDSDRLAALHDTLTASVEALVGDAAWQRMLTAAACFHRYSLSNVLLILTQRPDATRVAGIRTWNRLGRRVHKGERGIAILAPCTYRGEPPDDDGGGRDSDQPPAEPGAAPRRVLRGFRIVHVFDIGQTEGDPIPDVQPVVLDGDDPARLFDALAAQVCHEGYAVRSVPGLTDTDGAPVDGLTQWGPRVVSIDAALPQAHATHTLAHELGHVLLHRPPTALSPTQVEVEAESLAYIVCTAAGLDSGPAAAPYVARWSGGDLTVIRDSAERVLAGARTVLGRLAADTGALADVTAPAVPEVQP